METEEIILIRQALTYSVACLEIRLEDLIKHDCDLYLTQMKLDEAKKALEVALRLT